MKKIIMIMLVSFMSINGATYACCNEESMNLWSVDGALGVASYPKATSHDGQTAVGRLSLSLTLMTDSYWQAGIEAGIQSGNTMRLALPKEDIDVLGGVPIEAELKPVLDALFGLKLEPMADSPLLIWLKGGVAWRSFQLDRDSVPDLTGFAPEIQAGLGYRINERATVNLGYQYIWGKNPELTVNPLTETGVLYNIPSQQAVMIGFSFNF